MGLSLTTSKMNCIRVTVDQFTKSAHFIEFHDSSEVDKVVQFYIKEVVCFHGMPKDVVSNQDLRF